MKSLVSKFSIGDRIMVKDGRTGFKGRKGFIVLHYYKGPGSRYAGAGSYEYQIQFDGPAKNAQTYNCHANQLTFVEQLVSFAHETDKGEIVWFTEENKELKRRPELDFTRDIEKE